MKHVCIVTVLATLVLTAGRKYPDGWQFVPLPAEDEYATNRFGRSWLEPVYNGYLIVGNRYIEAPYVVEQRGFVIFVNNERIEDGTDIRLLSPVPTETPVTEDPGFPTDITETTSLDSILFHPVCVRKQLYWNYLGIYGEERFRLGVDYYRKLPCIKEVIDDNRSVMGDRLVTLVDKQGRSSPLILQTAPKTPMRSATDREMFGEVVGALGSDRYVLEGGAVIQILNGSLRGGAGTVRDGNKWTDVFKILLEDVSVSQKVARIRATEALGSVSDHHIMTMLPMDGFIPTSQLWQRLSGDMSWTNDAPARLLALTNGWQKILPAFMRTQNVAVVTGPMVLNTPSGTQLTGASKVTGTAATSRSTVPVDVENPAAKGGSRCIWVTFALSGVLVVCFFLMRHFFHRRGCSNR